MATWLYEAGLGEARAALLDRGRIVEMEVEPDDVSPLRVGAILSGRLVAKADAGGRGRVRLADGTEIELTPVPRGVAEGARLLVEIIREALPDRGRTKPARARPAAPDAVETAAPTLLERIMASGAAVRILAPNEADALEEAGWSERIEEAATGLVARPQAMLHISLTPAMTLIDVDGAGGPAALAVAGARLAGEAIRCFGIAGSIGIDLPTLPGKVERQAAAEALDAVLPQPFERTAVNGFGFLQIVRRRSRMSLPERIAADPATFAARQLLRRAERAGGIGAVELAAAPSVIAAIAARPDWTETLARRIGGAVRLRADAGLPIWSGHAQRDHL